MKKIVCLLCVVFVCALLPVTVFAEEIPLRESTYQEMSITPRATKVSGSISKVSSSSVRISATVFGSSSSRVTAVCQLQRYVNGTWTNYGTALSSSGTGSATATKTLTVTAGYSYRTKATNSAGAIAYSSTISM